MTKKTLKDFLEVYKPKSPDEQKFVDKHVAIKHKDRNGNGDDVFKATNIKTVERKKERHGYDVGEDEKVYEEVEDVEEARIYPGDYHVTSEKSPFGGHRPKVVHKDKGHTMYLGQHAYKKPAMAIRHGEAYLTAYAARGDRAADNASIDFARANKKHLYVKEDIDIEAVLDEALDLLMSIDEKTLTPAEMKKREEVVKAIKRENPKMDKSMAYAVATKTAKRVAEGVVPTADEPTEHDKKMAQKVRDLLAKEKKPVKEEAEDIDEAVEVSHDRYRSSHGKKASGPGAWMFTHKRSGEATGDDTFTAPATARSFTGAAKHAKAWAKSKGHRTVYVMEEAELDEAAFAPTMRKAIAAHERGDHKRAKYHLDNAKTARYAMKSTEISKHKDLLDKYKELRALHEEVEDLDESVAKVAQHLIKRYGENVRKSHVRSAANDFGVGFVALSHHVRKKLGVNRLEEEQIDELSKKTLGAYGSKALRAGLSGDEKSEKRMKGANLASAKMYPSQYEKSPLKAKVVAKEEVEELDEISAKKLTDYTAKASDARSHRDMSTSKLDKRYKSMALAHEKIRGRHAKVPANEDVEHIDELSKKTLGSYTYKAASELGSKGITTGLKIAADEPTEKNFKKMANRQRGVATAVKKLTKEDIINRSIDKYVPEDVKFTPEERLLKRLDGLSEAHVNTLLGLFEALNKDNQNKMIETVETREGINQLLNFALENRGE